MSLNRSGQALVEWGVLLPLFVALLYAIAVFGRWFVIRTEIILGVREAALLYSSGHMTSGEVRLHLMKTFRAGSPSVKVLGQDIQVGRRAGFQGRLWELDEVRVRYQIPNVWMKAFRLSDMEETCVIKHAPAYGPIGSPIGIHYGRPVDW